MPNRGSIIAAGALAAALATTPAPAELVSYAYDGVYEGGAAIVRDLSDPACPTLPLYRIEIRDGALRAWDGGRQTVKGVITHDGFFNADYYFADGRARVFEGAIDRGGVLTGGVFYQRCAYLVTLYKTR